MIIMDWNSESEMQYRLSRCLQCDVLTRSLRHGRQDPQNRLAFVAVSVLVKTDHLIYQTCGGSFTLLNATDLAQSDVNISF